MRRAFTIIELLVVIGILALLMGLTVGAIANTRRSDKLLATEHLVGDLIRQARHSARTTGAPVVVLVEQDPPRVQGVSQVPVWIEDFDGSGGIAGSVPAGVTGRGYQIDLTVGNQPPEHALTLASDRLVRSAGRADGFYIGCQVLPPPVPAGGSILPLVVVGTPSSPGVISRNASVCGLALQARQLDLQRIDSGDAQGAGTGQHPVLRTWELIGWVGDGTDAPPEVSSVAIEDRPVDIVRDEPILHASVDVAGNDHPEDVATPLAGGRWTELGMLFEPAADGWRMVLYRDGVRVAERRFATAPVLRRDDESVVVGQVELVISGSPTTQTSDNAMFDGIRVSRLATADPSPLPTGVVPERTYRIVAHPDGRVEVNQVDKLATTADAATAPASSELVFTGNFAKTAKAVLTVSVDGRVDGKLVAP